MFNSISNQHAYKVALWLPPLTYPQRCFNKKGSLAFPAFRPILLAPARTSHPSGVGGEAGAPAKEALGKAATKSCPSGIFSFHDAILPKNSLSASWLASTWVS